MLGANLGLLLYREVSGMHISGFEIDVAFDVGCTFFILPYDVKTTMYFHIYSNLELTYISDMMQIFGNGYVPLTIFSVSFEYIFKYCILITHLLPLIEYRSPIDTTSHLQTIVEFAGSRGHTFILN